MSKLLLEELSDRVLQLTINRPEKRNALNQQLILDLQEAIKKASKNKAVGCIILSGAGTQAFCAGADLSEMLAAKTQAKRRKFFSGLAELIGLMHTCPKPIIAKVHGFALAGGCGLAVAADLTFASRSAVFGLPEANLGILPMIVSLPIERAIGRKALARLVLTAEQIGAEEALRMGLVSNIFDATELDTECARIARNLADKPASAMKAGKELIYSVAEGNYSELLKRLPAKIAKLSMIPEVEEKIRAIVSKR